MLGFFTAETKFDAVNCKFGRTELGTGRSEFANSFVAETLFCVT